MSEFEEQNSFEGRQVPNDNNAERYLLGGILRDPDVMTTVTGAVPGEEFFYFERHQLIWRAISNLYRMGTPIDMLTLPAEMERRAPFRRLAVGNTFLT